jgi:hypothetical protein
VGEETGLDIVFTGRYMDGDGTGETATVTRDGSAFQGYIETAFNDTHLMLYVYNDTGDLLDLKNTSFSHTAASQWTKLRFRRITQVSVKTNDYYGWIDDFAARPFTFPEPSFALGIEENLNHTSILDATLQNATPSRVKHEHFDNKTNANGKYFENDYTFLANDDGTWRINATARFENNAGRANITFTVNGGAAPPATFNIQSVNTYTEQTVGENAFEEEELVVIRSEVTHASGAALVFGSFANITSPNGTVHASRANMTNIASVTVGGDPGYRFEYNFSVPLDPDEGVWTIDIFANSTDALTATSSKNFDVVVFKDIDISPKNDAPFTLFDLFGVPGGGAFGLNRTGAVTVRLFPRIQDHVDFIAGGSEFQKPYGTRGIGSGRMPGFGHMLSRAQIGAIVEYERSLTPERVTLDNLVADGDAPRGEPAEATTTTSTTAPGGEG